MTASVRSAVIALFACLLAHWPIPGHAQSANPQDSAKSRAHLARCAQDWSSDTKLRIAFREGSHSTGRFAGLTGDSVLLLTMPDRTSPAPIPLSRISLVEEPAGVKRHVAVGALAGLGLGLIVGAIMADAAKSNDAFADLSDTYVAIGGLTGIVAGGVAGYFITSDHWAVGCRLAAAY